MSFTAAAGFFLISCTHELPQGALGKLLFRAVLCVIPSPQCLSSLDNTESFRCPLYTGFLTGTCTHPCSALPIFKIVLFWVAGPLKRDRDYSNMLTFCHFPFFLSHYNHKDCVRS